MANNLSFRGSRIIYRWSPTHKKYIYIVNFLTSLLNNSFS